MVGTIISAYRCGAGAFVLSAAEGEGEAGALLLMTFITCSSSCALDDLSGDGAAATTIAASPAQLLSLFLFRPNFIRWDGPTLLLLLPPFLILVMLVLFLLSLTAERAAAVLKFASPTIGDVRPPLPWSVAVAALFSCLRC